MQVCISRVPDQNGVSQAGYIVEIYHSGRKPSIYKCNRHKWDLGMMVELHEKVYVLICLAAIFIINTCHPL